MTRLHLIRSIANQQRPRVQPITELHCINTHNRSSPAKLLPCTTVGFFVPAFTCDDYSVCVLFNAVNIINLWQDFAIFCKELRNAVCWPLVSNLSWLLNGGGRVANIQHAVDEKMTAIHLKVFIEPNQC